MALAHLGVLFLDELPEFHPQVLDALRQPLETGETVIARANHRISYPSRIQLIAAMNPCRCGRAGRTRLCLPPRQRCCAERYQARISGPMLDRIDLQIEVPAVSAADLVLPQASEGSAEVRARVTAARRVQVERFAALGLVRIRTNAECDGALLEEIAAPDRAGLTLLRDAADALSLSARGYHRTLPGRAHAGRPRRRGEGRPHPCRRGLELSRRDPAAGASRRLNPRFSATKAFFKHSLLGYRHAGRDEPGRNQPRGVKRAYYGRRTSRLAALADCS